jgi:hypothetical protein
LQYRTLSGVFRRRRISSYAATDLNLSRLKVSAPGARGDSGAVQSSDNLVADFLAQIGQVTG